MILYPENEKCIGHRNPPMTSSSRGSAPFNISTLQRLGRDQDRAQYLFSEHSTEPTSPIPPRWAIYRRVFGHFQGYLGICGSTRSYVVTHPPLFASNPGSAMLPGMLWASAIQLLMVAATRASWRKKDAHAQAMPDTFPTWNSRVKRRAFLTEPRREYAQILPFCRSRLCLRCGTGGG